MLDLQTDSLIPSELADAWAKYKGLIIGGIALLIFTFMILLKGVSS